MATFIKPASPEPVPPEEPQRGSFGVYHVYSFLEAFPESNQANEYRELARKVLANEGRYVPTPVTMKEIKEIVLTHTGDAYFDK